MAKTIAGKMFFNHFAIRRLRGIIRQCKVDLVHVNTTWTYVGAIAALAEKVPFVWHLREFLEEDQGRTMWSRQMGNALIARANAAVAISSAMKDKYSPIVGHTTLTEILNGIDEAVFQVERRTLFCDNPYAFVMLGNFNRHKGHLEFAKACAELYRDGFHDFRVWFVGEGDNDVKAECLQILGDSGMGHSVTCWGFQKHPEQFLLQADAAFMCSRFEAFGRVTVEAMMAGCLVVGAATAATVELIRDGETGLLYSYEPGGFESIVEKMKQAVSQPGRMRVIAAAGRDHALKHFTAKRNAREVAELYRAVLPSVLCC